MVVICPELVEKKDQFWTPARDNTLRMYYNDKVHVEPAMLGMTLGCTVTRVINRLAALKLRDRRTTHYEQRSNYQRRV